MTVFATTTWAERKVTNIVTPSSENALKNDTVHCLLYNADGQLMWRQNPTTSSRDVYFYNEKGQLTEKLTRSWIPYDRAYKDLNKETYTYGADGNVSRMDQTRNIASSFESKRYYLYTAYDEKGNATAWQHYNDKDVLYYEYKADYTYNANGNVEKKVVQEFDPDYPEDGYYAFETYEYTFKTNGDIDTETIIVYKSDGSEKSKITQHYCYSELDAKYVPQNLKAQKAGEDDVDLTWNAVDNASAYVVTYGELHVKVNGTKYTAKDIATGDVEFTVQAIVGGEEKNAATPVVVSIVDEGNLPAQNLMAGTPYKTVEQTDSEDRTYYIIPLTWELPAGHSEIKDIRICYNSRVFGTTYISTEKANATSFNLKLDEYEVLNTEKKPILDADGNPEIDEETGEPKTEDVYTDGADVNIYVIILYGSGESEHSNELNINPYNMVNGIEDGIEDGIETIRTSDKFNFGNTIYNLAGQRISHQQKGIVIKAGKKILK